jgi:predicted phage tail protein
VGALLPAAATATEVTVTGLTSQRYWLRVFAVNGVDVSEASGESSAVPGTRPGSARIGTAAPDDSAAVVHWLAPADDGGLAVTGYRVRAVDESGAPAGSLRSASAASTRLRVRGLTNGEAYRFQVAAVNEMGVGRFSRLSGPVVPGTPPAGPVVRRPDPGPSGGRLTVTARWSPPATASVPAITGYRVTALRMASDKPGAKVLRRLRSPALEPGRRTFRFVLPEWTYRFQVVAFNTVGRGAPSEVSGAVRAR